MLLEGGKGKHMRSAGERVFYITWGTDPFFLASSELSEESLGDQGKGHEATLEGRGGSRRCTSVKLKRVISRSGSQKNPS